MSKYDGFTQARREANARYDAKTYKKVLFLFRVDDDADIIESLKRAQESGMNKREWIREIYEKSK